MRNPVEKTVEVTLDQPRKLYFNMNTYQAFEDVTGEMFLGAIVDLQERFVKESERLKVKGQGEKGMLALARCMSMKTLMAMLWAACHEYDDKDEPHWPLSLPALSRYVHAGTLPQIMKALFKGTKESQPKGKDEMPLSSQAAKESKKSEVEEDMLGTTRPTDDENLPGKSGGFSSGPSDDEILASLERKSED